MSEIIYIVNATENNVTSFLYVLCIMHFCYYIHINTNIHT
jgi:hypothetical protein